MASEKQYQFFRTMYDDETGRAQVLQDHAKNTLSLATLYSAFILFVIDKSKPATVESRAIFIAAIICMLVAFFLSLWASNVSVYEAITRPRSIIEGFGDTPPTDEEFFDDRIADCVVAYERNHSVNDIKAIYLAWARYALLLGIFFHACYFILLTTK